MSVRHQIAVVGLGYVGLPTAIELHKMGHSILGIDTSKKTIETLEKGESHLKDLGSLTDEVPLRSDNWKLESSYTQEIGNMDFIIITVPTPTNADNSPDLSYIEGAVKEVMGKIKNRSETVLIIESTVFPGVSRKIVTKYAISENKEIGIDFHFAYCPERIDPGVKKHHISNLKRIVGADNPIIGELLVGLYTPISGGASYVGPPEVSEAAKLIENVQRDVDIALTNELAVVLSEFGLDSEEVFSAADSKWNFHRHKPGIGVGGHCIAVDPYYYLSLFDSQNKVKESIVRLSRTTNNLMPDISSNTIISDLSLIEGQKVIVFGFAYKKNVGDYRNTPVLDLLENLQNKAIVCEIYEPLFTHSLGQTRWHSDLTTLSKDYDAIIVATPHDIFDLNPDSLAEFCPEKKIFDGRRSLSKNDFEKRGWTFSGIGIGSQHRIP